MGFSALHRLRRRSRGIALATVAVFALNWLGLALMPCAMASAIPVPTAHASAGHAPADDPYAAMSPECRARMAAQAGTPTAPSDEATPGHTATTGSPCPWCLSAGTTAASAAHDTGCSATSKPALDTRDVKGFQSPLLVALSATVLALLPLETLAAPAVAAEPILPPAAPAVDRYCRRLE